MRLLVGGRANLLRELVNLRDDAGDLLQRAAQVATQRDAFIHNAGRLFHVVDGLARFLLDALDELGNFSCRLRRLLRQLADFIGHYGKAQAMLAGAGRFNGSIQGQQVRLLSQVINHLDDLANIVRALPKRGDDLCRRTNGRVDAAQAVCGLFHGVDAVVHFIARALRDIQQHLGRVGHPLD